MGVKMSDDFKPVENNPGNLTCHEFFGEESEEIDSTDLFDDVLGNRVISNKLDTFDPLMYLVDVKQYLEKHPIKEVKCDINEFTKDSLANLSGMEWLNFVECHLLAPVSESIEDQTKQLIEFKDHLMSEATAITHEFCPGSFPRDFNEKALALDTETTGLDTRCMYDYSGNLIINTELVGFSVAISDNEGWYLPIQHTGTDCVLNWDFDLIILFLETLHKEFFLIYHNAIYDREVLAINGMKGFRKWPYFCDTQSLHFFHNVNNKVHGLKMVSEKILGRRMIAIEQLFNFGKKKKGAHICFNKLPAKGAYVYGCSDVINTFGIFKYFGSKGFDGNSFLNSPVPLTIDHKSVDVLRNISRGGVPVDYDYFLYAAKDTEYRIMILEDMIYNYVGRKINIGSPDQVSDLLFDQYNIPVLQGEERNKKGRFSTKQEVLDNLFEKYADYPILRYVVMYRKLSDIITKTYLKVVLNFYIDALLPWTKLQAQYSQTVIPTGRFSSSCSSGKSRVIVNTTQTGNLTYNYYQGSGDADLNLQGIPSKIHMIMKKAKRIKRISSESGIDPNNPYPQEVMENLIKRITAL